MYPGRHGYAFLHRMRTLYDRPTYIWISVYFVGAMKFCIVDVILIH